MAGTFSNVKTFLEPGGYVTIKGIFNLGVYTTSGVQINCANYLKSTATPVDFQITPSTGKGYHCELALDGVSNSNIMCFYENVNIAANAALVEVANAANLANVNVFFSMTAEGY